MPESLKHCQRCHRDKSASEFGRDRTRPDGRYPYCRSCRRVPERVARSERAAKLIGLANASRHPLYGTWCAMISRCENPRHRAYKDYGGRGISVHDPWHDPVIFIRDILAELGPKPEGTTLDRIENDGSYAPGNIRWATRREQIANRRTRSGGLSPAELANRRSRVRDLLDQGRTWRQITEELGASKWAVRGDIDLLRGKRP